MQFQQMCAGFLLIGAMACSGDEITDHTDGMTDGMTDGTMSGSTGDSGTSEPTDAERAAALWTGITGYDSWDQPKNWVGIQPAASGSPHTPNVQIWMNPAAAGSFDSGTFADGSVFVKRVYTSVKASDVQPPTIVMQKIAGYGTSGWFWAVFDAEGNADPAGDVKMCIGCHSAGTDYARSATDVPGAGM